MSCLPMMLKATLPRVIGVIVGLAGIAVALLWRPICTVYGPAACPTPMPGDHFVCPRYPAGTLLCSGPSIALRIGIAVGAVVIGAILVGVASRRELQNSTLTGLA